MKIQLNTEVAIFRWIYKEIIMVKYTVSFLYVNLCWYIDLLLTDMLSVCQHKHANPVSPYLLSSN